MPPAGGRSQEHNLSFSFLFYSFIFFPLLYNYSSEKEEVGGEKCMGVQYDSITLHAELA